MSYKSDDYALHGLPVIAKNDSFRQDDLSF